MPESKIKKSEIPILLISDNPKDILMLKMMSADIKSARREVVVAKNLKQATAQIKKSKFELILLDLTLKGNKGLSALLELEKLDLNCPIVILTEKEDPLLAMEAFKHHAQDNLIKGRIDVNLLARVIHYAIERHRIINEMIEKNHELTRLNALKSEFVSTVSHELRTPLTVILSATNNMLDGAIGPLQEEQIKWVKKIHGHASRLHEMINDILDLSKLQSGKTEIRRGLVEAKSLVRNTVDELVPLAQEKGLMLEANLPDTPTPVWADARHIERVITNLLSNAIKYTPTGGKITVHMKKKYENVEFVVEDNGPGIKAEHKDAIFERFWQIRQKDDPQKPTQGIGLGLAICKEIVTQHNGKIWVESKEEHGCRFIFYIPCMPPTTNAKAA